MNAQPATELRRKIAAACLLAAPLTMLAGDALKFGAGATRAWLVLLKLSFALFAGAALALVHLASRRADRAGLVGGALTIVGCLAGSGIATAFAVESSIVAAKLDESTMRALGTAFREGGVMQFVMLYPLPGLAFPAGLLVLSYALLRARRLAPRGRGAGARRGALPRRPYRRLRGGRHRERRRALGRAVSRRPESPELDGRRVGRTAARAPGGRDVTESDPGGLKSPNLLHTTGGRTC